MRFLTALITLALSSAAITPGSVIAGPKDLAPISDEIVQKLVRDPIARASNPMPELLSKSLDEAVEMHRAMAADAAEETRHAGSRTQAMATKRNLFVAKRREINNLKLEAMRQFAEMRAKLSALNLPDKVAAWDQKTERVRSRFARLDAAFAALDTDRPGNRSAALAQLKRELEIMHERPKARQAVPDANPQPTGRIAPSAGVPNEAPSEASPAYLSFLRPGDNLYAFLGNTLLSAAPITPPEATSCNYSAADLAATSDAVIDAEVQALAQQLNYSPAKIYQWVHDNIAFDPYYGSLKGSKGTLVAGRGNATDQASLLIALLRASNIPARYVRGTVQFDDTRVQRWLGVKTYRAAAQVLSQGGISTTNLLDPNNNTVGVRFNHVWVEACVPYGRYRGANIDNSGTRWIPLDASFKDKTYAANSPVSLAFDYSATAGKYMGARSDQLPNERYADDVQNQLRLSNPNATVQDVPYTGVLKSLKVDVLPASLPYAVNTFLNWPGTASPEIASLTDSHRYKFTVTVKNGATTLLTTQLDYPDAALKRLTLSFAPSDAASLTLWNSWGGDLAFLPAGTVNLAPVLKLDGVQVGSASGSAVLGQSAKLTLIMKLTLADENLLATCVNDTGNPADPVDADTTCLNKTVYTNITTGAYHALTAYAFQASNRYLTERAALLLTATRTYPAPTPANSTAYDATLGEYLNLVLMKYVRYSEDATRQVAALQGILGLTGNAIGLTASDMKVSYVLDEPYAVDIGAPLIDFKGGVSRMAKIDTTSTDAIALRNEIWPTFKLALYAGSALEHYVWQENARTDAVSTVRGLQFAAETGIPIYNFTAANIAQWDSLMDASMLPYKASIQNEVANGAIVTIPQKIISYTGPNQPKAWVGAVYMTDNQSRGSFGAIIAGGLAGGYPLISSQPVNGSIFFSDPFVPPAVVALNESFSSYVNSQTASNGACSFCTYSNDPVNMLTGNLYHTERDVSIPGRGGLPLVFERSYNSRNAKDGPLGFGWSHSFNHFIRFYGVDGAQAKIGWNDGSGGEKFFSTASQASGNINLNTTLTNPSGIFVTVKREANGTYTITEKNGLQYSFESINASSTDTNQKAKLLTIRDRNNNTLTLAYNPDATLKDITDGLGRKLVFTYANARITQLDFKSSGGTTLRSQSYSYDSAGNLTSFKNPLALASPSQPPISYTYYSAADGQNLAHAMKSYVLPRGNGMRFEYYANGKVFRHTTTLNEVTTFTYNDFRREAVATNARGFERRFFFDQNGNQAKLIEENGAERIYAYDPANPFNRTSKKDPRGYQTQYAYDALGNVTQATLPDGATMIYANFNAFNQPQRMQDARGNWTVLQYDAKGNLTNQIRLKTGVTPAIPYAPVAAQIAAWSVMGYDAFGNNISMRSVRDIAGQIANPASVTGPTLEYALDANNLYPTQVTRKGDKTGDGVADTPDSATLVYDTQGRQTQGIDADWQSRSTQYDLADRVLAATDALGKLRQFGYDANGNMTSMQLLDNGALVDSSLQEYDQSDRPYRLIDAGGNAMNTEYDPVGNPVKITDADGYSLAFVYDAAERALQAADKEGNSVSTQRDIDGQPRNMTDPNGNSITYVYWDATRQGRLKQSIDAANRSTTLDYDANGNVIQVTDNLNRTTLTQYDALNRPVRIAGPVYSDATLGNIRPVTSFSYDALSNRTQIKAGYTTDTSGQSSASDVLTTQLTQVFDDFSRKIKETDALNKTTVWQYDLYNNVTQATDAKGQTTIFTWDTGHQLKTLKDQSNNLYSYTRNSLGQPIQIVSPTVTYSYQYDAAHRLTSLTDSRGNKSLNYAYSPGGLLNNQIDSDGNRTDYLYDAVGRLTGIWAPNYDYVAFGYDRGGRLIEKWYPNGVDAQFNWNPDNTLASLTNKVGSSTLSSHVYGYDGVGNRSTQTETINGSAINYSYQYDNLNRLTQVQNGTAANQENYAYDPLGNRKTRTINATTPSTIAYVYDAANQLKEIRQTNTTGPLTTAFVYDANGSLTSKCEGTGVTTNGVTCVGTTTTNLTYDALSRLTQAAKTGQTSQTYGYDDQDRRIRKTVGSSTNNFLYGGPDIVAEYPSNWGTPTAQYTHGANTDEPLARITQTGAQYFHQDGLGSVVALSNNLGGTDATQRFDAWGNQIASTGAQSRYGYTGREPDETGLVYYRARYYDPQVGRFTQRDLIGLQGGINQYAYVDNNPINATDPSGQIAVIDNVIAGGVNALVGYGVSKLTGEKYGAAEAAIDFGVGAASNGLSLGGKFATVGKLALPYVEGAVRGAIATGGEFLKGAISKEGITDKTKFTAVVAGVLNATGVVGKVAEAIGERIPGLSKLFYQPNPSVAALLQAPALAPGVVTAAKEFAAFPGNFAAGVSTDELGSTYFGSGSSSGSAGLQNLNTFVNPPNVYTNLTRIK